MSIIEPEDFDYLPGTLNLHESTQAEQSRDFQYLLRNVWQPIALHEDLQHIINDVQEYLRQNGPKAAINLLGLISPIGTDEAAQEYGAFIDLIVTARARQHNPGETWLNKADGMRTVEAVILRHAFEFLLYVDEEEVGTYIYIHRMVDAFRMQGRYAQITKKTDLLEQLIQYEFEYLTDINDVHRRVVEDYLRFLSGSFNVFSDDTQRLAAKKKIIAILQDNQAAVRYSPFLTTMYNMVKSSADNNVTGEERDLNNIAINNLLNNIANIVASIPVRDRNQIVGLGLSFTFGDLYTLLVTTLQLTNEQKGYLSRLLDAVTEKNISW